MNRPLSSICTYALLVLTHPAIAAEHVAAADGPSVVVNGDFEQLDEGGKATGWAASRIESLPDGNHVLVVPFTWSFNQVVKVEPSTRYLLAMNVKRRRGPSAARLAVNVRDKAGDKLTTANIFHPFVGDDWETARGLLTTSANADNAIVYILTFDKNRESEFLCDNVRITPLGKGQGLGGRIWHVPDPLCSKLLGDEPPGLVREGAMVWGHMLKPGQLRDVAARMGRRYSEEETIAHLAKHKLHPIWAPRSPFFKKHGLTSAIYPSNKAPGAKSMLEPKSIDFYIERVRQTLTDYPGQIWAIFAQDEAEEHAIREIITIAKDPSEDYEYLDVIEREVREQFGFSRFGLPTGSGPEEPFRWIAFRRWVNRRFRTRHERLSKLVRETWPQVRLISTDPMGRLSPFEFSRQTSYFDIFTQQFLPRSNPLRCPLGLYVKLIADLTGKEVWPCVHVENYAYPTTPGEVRELYSQVWRNGGSGFHLYIPDTANARKKKGDTRLTQWGSPRRYRAILEIIDRAAKQNRLRFPQDEGCRILYSNYAHMAFANPGSIQDPMEACYTLIGPGSRSWFTIIDEHRLADPLTDRPAKAIYLPYGRIMDQATRQRLEQFVAGGGTLVLADPEAFEYDIDGKPTRDARRKLVGAELLGRKAKGLCITVPPHPLLPGIELPHKLLLLSSPYRIEPQADTEVLGRYDDGAAAITLRRHGDGRVIYFAIQPFAAATMAAPDWQRLFKSLQKGLGFSTDLDIWRFTFPAFETVDRPAPQGVCLTNNHVEWREEQQHLTQNVETGGAYSLSPPPDRADDDGDAESIPFAEGDLTDRAGWPELEKVKATSYVPYAEPLAKWVDTWSRGGEVAVTFDFVKPRQLLRVRLFFMGSLPGVQFEGSLDGKSWTPLGRADGVDAGKDVLDTTVTSRSSSPFRYARLQLTPREQKLMTLTEVEVWGDE